MNHNEPLVNVCLITYNQEKFIAQTIESVLMQRTNFHYKIIIGEDYSTDRTREICLEYQKNYPDKISLLLHKTNLGAVRNHYETHNACTAKYIAMLDGDDFWTDPLKLQKQFDFLEANADYSGCFHQVNYVTLNNNDVKYFPENLKKKTFTTEDIIAFPTTGWVIMTSTFFFKRKGIEHLPKWFTDFKLGDWSLVLMTALNGEIGYINEVLGTYRENSGSLMQSTHFSDTQVTKTLYNIFIEFNKETQFKYKELIRKQLQYFLFQIIEDDKKRKKWVDYYIHTIKFNIHSIKSRSKKPASLKDLVLIILDYYRFIFRKVV